MHWWWAERDARVGVGVERAQHLIWSSYNIIQSRNQRICVLLVVVVASWSFVKSPRMLRFHFESRFLLGSETLHQRSCCVESKGRRGSEIGNADADGG